MEPRKDSDARRRQALRRFASGVAVVTAGDGSRVHGTTVSAVTAVSRNPLLIAVCLRRRSAFLDHALGLRRFAVNVLAADQEPLAYWFANRDRPAGPAQFAHVPWKQEEFSGAPQLYGALSTLGCRLITAVSAGDHEVLLAEVRTGSYDDTDRSPLLSFAGRLNAVPLEQRVLELATSGVAGTNRSDTGGIE